MKALAICGSPRENGNTEFLLRRCLDRLKAGGLDVELVRLGALRILPCKACGACAKTKDRTCAQKGDDFQPLFEKMAAADILITGSPVYFGSATPQLMTLLDRAGYVARANGGLLTRKIGGPLVVARRAGHNFTFAQLLLWFMINGMVVPGSSYWNIAFGRDIGEVQKDEEGLRTMDQFADNLLWLAGKLRAG